MNTDILEKIQETGNDIACKIDSLKIAFDDLQDSIELYQEYMAEMTSNALNELLKIGVVPNARIRHHALNDRDFICIGYKGDNIIFYDLADTTEKPKEYKASIIGLLKIKDRWEVIK